LLNLLKTFYEFYTVPLTLAHSDHLKAYYLWNEPRPFRQKVVRKLSKVFVREHKVVEEFKVIQYFIVLKLNFLLEDLKSLCPVLNVLVHPLHEVLQALIISDQLWPPARIYVPQSSIRV